MDTTQVLLFSVVTILTALLVAVGIQVFFILRELKNALYRVNKILDDASFVSGAVARPVAGLASFVDGLKSIKDLVDFVAQKTEEKNLPAGYEEGSQPSGEEGEQPQQSYHQSSHRFFHKDGKPLTS